MKYKETIQWLFQRLLMFQRMGKTACETDLENAVELLNLPDNPHYKSKAVYVAGTNGKGCVSNIIASVLRDAVPKTGLYTPDHLKDFRDNWDFVCFICFI